MHGHAAKGEQWSMSNSLVRGRPVYSFVGVNDSSFAVTTSLPMQESFASSTTGNPAGRELPAPQNKSA